MQTLSMLSKAAPLRATSFAARVARDPRRMVATAPVLRRHVAAQAGNGEAEESNVPSVPEQQSAMAPRSMSPLSSTLGFPMFPGRVGSMFRELEEEMNALTRSFGMPSMMSPFEIPSTIAEMPRAEKLLACDIKDKGDHLEISADVPGLTANDIKITVSPDNVLSISGERKMEKKEEDKEGQVYRVERSFGSFMRRFKLPPGVDAEAISAESKDGVLRLSIPKAEEEKKEHKVIQIKTSEE